MTTPIQAGAVMKRARILLRAGALTPHQFTILDCMVWSCRAPGQSLFSVSYSKLQRLAHVSRDTVWRGIARLEALGLIAKTKRRVLVRWALGIASRQATNAYRLIVPVDAPSTESDRRSVYRELDSKRAQEQRPARRALPLPPNIVALLRATAPTHAGRPRSP